MTHMGRALVFGPIVGPGSPAVAVAGGPDEPMPVGVEPIAAHQPASAGRGELMTFQVVSRRRV